MDPNLVHSSGERSAQYHTRSSVIIETFKLSAAFLSTGGNFAHANLVTDDLYGLSTFCHAPIKNKKENIIPMNHSILQQYVFSIAFRKFQILLSRKPQQTSKNYLELSQGSQFCQKMKINVCMYSLRNLFNIFYGNYTAVT